MGTVTICFIAICLTPKTSHIEATPLTALLFDLSKLTIQILKLLTFRVSRKPENVITINLIPTELIYANILKTK